MQSRLMTSHQTHSSAVPSAPILDLAGAGAFNLTYGDEPLPLERPAAIAALMVAIRGVDVWRIVWLGPESSLVLYQGEKEIWRAEMNVNAELASLKLTAPFKVVAGQFRDHNERSALHIYRAWPSVAARLVRGLKARVSSPAAVGRSLLVLGRWFLMLMGFVLCSTMLAQCMGRDTAAGPAKSAQSAAAGAVPPELRDRTLGETLSPTEMQVVANTTREMGIQMRPSGQPFVIFSDPNCPSCKDLEAKLSQVDPRFVPVIVPVSFKPGSEDLVKRVLCAKDTVSAWSAAIGAYEPSGDAASDGSCAGAADKMVKANAAFVALNFSGTPTLVSATGKVVAGSGSLDDINKWLVANGGLRADAPPAAR
ncbi:thioredoxin fold domain-containing protein [Variovorax sp. LjRoot290]|uniref:thioredoxin fold domain-containing protein n=1 Tax=Variovorax sp. LjRoot290 TaxID=3342316 RepID=UPI003ECD4424